MKSLVCDTPRELNYREINQPSLSPGQTILKIKRIGICGTDLHAFDGTQPFFSYPRILGHELAGEIVAMDGAEGFAINEKVTFIPYFNCGHCVACKNGKPNCCVDIRVFGVHIDGGMAEYISVPSYSLVHGEGLSYDELALVEPLAIGAHSIRRAEVRKDEFVLVIGAGPIGLGTMEFARIAGARVIAMDINNGRLEFCKNRLKISHTVNALEEDVKKRLIEITEGEMPTVVIDATGSLKAINNGFQYLAHGGKYVLVGLQKGEISFSHPEFHKREATLMSSRNATREDFEHVINSMKKKLVDPTNYITHRVGFEDLKEEFAKFKDPANGVIKAVAELN
ncbi:2-desacetyl-2-hydroxyethyl bacteriochlorophyllide A dehydrogenase [Pseudarcicella hirudinis]|uniref:2-desacetyl-2-hydroxyethyl bacteriochlorophyllide A dehydrogenase n=1 Tax=Pseudarcicella hirudinis TaxID=1079859 RepID=A0A1I5XYF5_9BACT|nr:zinc-binding alcohol dehydrogenase family protein [Pseudarcicella hirudinis]SFQ36936.1 2-desacetyl-2-hydroxyethyl bacteriochlorophyllide A dehydrogenase [Pseudarcicella hirudinis]